MKNLKELVLKSRSLTELSKLMGYRYLHSRYASLISKKVDKYRQEICKTYMM